MAADNRTLPRQLLQRTPKITAAPSVPREPVRKKAPRQRRAAANLRGLAEDPYDEESVLNTTLRHNFTS